MTNEEQLESYRKQLSELDEQEATLASFQRKGQQLVENTYYEIRSAIQNIAETNEPLNLARQELGNLEADFSERLSREKRKVYAQREELETSYRKLKSQIEQENK